MSYVRLFYSLFLISDAIKSQISESLEVKMSLSTVVILSGREKSKMM